MTSAGLFYIQPAADKSSKRDRKQDAKAADDMNKKQASLLKADLFFIHACYQAFS